MLKSNYKNSIITNSSIELKGDLSLEGNGKGHKFISRFIEPGIAEYKGTFGKILITKETLDSFIMTMVGCPVIIKHKDITDENVDKERVGVVSDVWYNEGDGWYYCSGILFDKQAIDLVKNHGWSVSCTYDFETDNTKGTYHGLEYDMQFTGGEFLHLALVDNPRYEQANITVANSKDEEQTTEENSEVENSLTSIFAEAIAEVVTNCLGELRARNDTDFENKHKRIPKGNKNGGQFAKQNEGSKKDIKPYIPHFGRKPNPNFKYDYDKIKTLIADIEPEIVKENEIPIFSDDKDFKNWVISEFAKNRTVTILSDNEEILLSKNSAGRVTFKQKPDNIEKNAVFFKIKNTLEKSKYYDFEPKNEAHKDKNIQGQYVYFSKINIDTKQGIQPYRVLFKIDVPNDEDIPLIYAGHRIEKI